MNEQTIKTENPEFSRYSGGLWKGIGVLWLLTVAAVFENGGLLQIPFPGLGSLYGFRVFLPLTAILFVVWAWHNRVHIWRESSALERWAYLFAFVLVLYGAFSLPRAISLDRTARMLFNVTLDMVFFFLMLQLDKEKQLRKKTYTVLTAGLFAVLVLATYEVYFGGIVDHAYDDFRRFFWFHSILQSPIVFYSNTNDISSMLLFLLAALTAGGVFWNGRKWSNVILSSAATVWTYFLILAADSRLCLFAFWFYIAGVAIYSFLKKENRKTLIVCLLLTALGLTGVILCNRLAPSRNGIEWASQQTLGDMANEFYDIDPETGEKILTERGSAGIRARLLVHAFRCLWESHGLGVGLANTGQLALTRKVAAIMGKRGYYESIHCFIARLLGDYGLFAGIPITAIGLLLVYAACKSGAAGAKRHDRDLLARAIRFFLLLLLYPVVSTASSDAQDCIPMWIYLAVMIREADTLFMLAKKGTAADE